MKIIFDNEEELIKFYDDFCPNDIGLEIHCNDEMYTDTTSCENCWTKSGLEYEIKNDQLASDETILNLNDNIKVKLTDYGIHVYYHQYDVLIGLGAPLKRCYPTVDEEGYTDFQVWDFMNLYGPHMKLGDSKQIIEDNAIYIQKPAKKEPIKMIDKTPKEITYTDAVYELIKEECGGMDSIYEDYIVKLVGQCGLGALKRANLIESCGVVNCRRLWVLCEKNEDKLSKTKL